MAMTYERIGPKDQWIVDDQGKVTGVRISGKNTELSGIVTSSRNPVTGGIENVSADGKSVLQAAAMVARSRSNIETVSIGNSGGFSTTTTTNRTWQRVVGLRSVPLILRVQYVNPHTVAYTVDKTNIKLSTAYVANAGGGDPAGAMTPLNVLWSSAASVEAAIGSAAAPSHTAWSDPLFLPTVTRSDGGTFPIAYIRSFIANAGATGYPYLGANNYANNPANNINGLVRLCGFQAGDFITTPTGFTDVTGLRLPMNLEFTEFCRGIKIVSLGDSVTSGNASGGGIGGVDRSFVDVALESINPTVVSYGTILSHANCGVSSKTIPEFLGLLDAILTQQTPDVVIIPIWSPNTSPTTKAALDVNNGLVLQAISKIMASGAVPILWSPVPKSASSTAAVDALRVSNTTYWRNIANQGGFYFSDISAACDGAVVASITQWGDGLSTDGTHPNTAGTIAMAEVLEPVLRAACGLL